jgi:hypothetical protein
MADEHESPIQAIRRIVDSIKRTPHVMSIGHEHELHRLYDQLAVDRFVEDAPKIPDGPSFDQDVGDLVNYLNAEMANTIHDDLECIYPAIRQWGGTARDAVKPLVTRVGEALQAARTKFIVQRAAVESARPPSEPEEWVPPKEAALRLGKSLDHTRTLYRTKKIESRKEKNGRVVISTKSIQDYLWPESRRRKQ